MTKFIEWALRLVSYKPQRFVLRSDGHNYIYD